MLEVELRWPTRTTTATLVAGDPLGFLFGRLRAWAVEGRLVADLARSEAAAEAGGVGLDQVLGIYGESLALLGRVVDRMVEPVPRHLPGDVPVVSAAACGWQPMAPELVRALVTAELGDAAFAHRAEQRARRWLADAAAEPWPDADERLEQAVGEYRAHGRALPPARMDAHVALVHELAEQLAGRPAVLDALTQGDGWATDEWMWNLAAVLAEAGRVDDAVAVSEAMATFHVPHREEHLANAALALARSGRAPEARARLAALLAEVPDDRLAATLCAEAYEAIGDAASAEAAYRRGVDLAIEGGQADEVEDALELLAAFHEGAGRPDDARAARGRLRSWRREARSAGATARPARSGGKVGRNQPCPCGSRRKYKRCCGGPTA